MLRSGHRFKTNSDTETLVHLYEEEGAGGISKLRGMFAYAIWDSRNRSLLLARDRFGKKPLYYCIQPEGLYFGSELKCLRAAGVPLEIDREALRLYFLSQLHPRSLDRLSNRSESCHQEVGCAITPAGRSRKAATGRFPLPAEQPRAGFTEQAARQQLRDRFDEAVRMRLIADVPLGAFLSGGIDSSSVVASMALQSKEPVKTFSIGFEEPDFNELPLAALVARKYNTEHHEIIVRPDSVDLVSKLVRHFDEPFADSSAIPTYLVSEFAAQHVKVALTGDGGDELFGGYQSFLDIQRSRSLDRVPQLARNFLSAVANALPYSAYGKNYLRMISRPTALERYFDHESQHFLLQNLLTPDWMPPADTAWITRTLAHCLLPNGADVLTQALYFEATAKLTGDMLVKVDRMSMANSLEVRCPMLDDKLAALAAEIPHAWKLRNGRGKDIFIEALGDRLPPELLRQPKRGFGVPLALWFRGSLRNFLWDHLTSEAFLHRGIVSPQFVRYLLEEHDRGRRDNYHHLWKLLMLELWFREWAPAPASAAMEARVV